MSLFFIHTDTRQPVGIVARRNRQLDEIEKAQSVVEQAAYTAVQVFQSRGIAMSRFKIEPDQRIDSFDRRLGDARVSGWFANDIVQYHYNIAAREDEFLIE